MSASQSLQVLSVGELTRCIRAVIEAEDLFREVWVRGEVSNLTKHSSGHVYFCLKDEAALLRCVMWNRAWETKLQRSLPARISRFRLEEGMSVIVHGRVTVYEKTGQYQLVATEITPDGVGALYVAFEQVKARLAAEGLFDETRKKPIPPFPTTIGILTSPTGAALRDMVTIARRRMPCVNLVLVPTVVQGEGSESSIVQALGIADSLPDVDVIVLGRGGGSLEDLWSFNTESVARAVSACRTPVVSAVGHETDYTLADMAADLRAPTPSAAMDLIVPDRRELLDRIGALVESAGASVEARLILARGTLDHLTRSPALRYPDRLLLPRLQTLDNLESRLAAEFEAIVSRCEARLGEVSAGLASLSPLGVLARGYGIVRRPDGRVITRISDTGVGETIEVLISDGRLISEVREIRKGWD